MKLNTKLCRIIDADKGFNNKALANKIEELFDKEISIYQLKALKWDELDLKITKIVNILPESSEEEIDQLLDIGEVSAKAFGVI